MAELIGEENKLVVKLVYYGPALSGKTTNLMRLHDLLDEGRRGELMTFETKGDRTLFFDLLPLVARSESGFTVKFKLFTVPGQVAHDATRKAVLSRADGIVFVADSRNDQAMHNFESFDNLERNARRVGLDLDKTPLVIQFNKRDLNDIVSETEVLQRWQPTGLPIHFASALRGNGVRETFAQLLVRTHRALDAPFQLGRRHGIEVDHFLQVLNAA
ncbi:GTP-binding protein [Desulfatitalea alkaliphila]|uniref:GTPase domain-containing protein n=1 Tax=Desulfatitalea alkaliphila TaxID=2929485 RepID=A0AA41R5M7_9BACT|nr:GTPase domain-containing protein [Desulfatitalea alkaliphila]MCJ8501485.1 GTPase domain-containing protein [Desulfatitalea alkaliphila]